MVLLRELGDEEGLLPLLQTTRPLALLNMNLKGQCHEILNMNLKGQCHEKDIFFEGLYILTSTFCVCADGYYGLSKAFHYPVQFSTFCLLL